MCFSQILTLLVSIIIIIIIIIIWYTRQHKIKYGMQCIPMKTGMNILQCTYLVFLQNWWLDGTTLILNTRKHCKVNKLFKLYT